MNRNHEVELCARRVSLWMLFAIDLTAQPAEELLFSSYSTLSELEPELSEAWELIEQRVTGIHEDLPGLNAKVQSLSPRWKLERMALIDRNILRLGVYEILELGCSPLHVINTCVELAKSYGEKGTPAFVNGLLDQLCKNHDITVA